MSKVKLSSPYPTLSEVSVAFSEALGRPVPIPVIIDAARNRAIRIKDGRVNADACAVLWGSIRG